jgi:hypothetical protein
VHQSAGNVWIRGAGEQVFSEGFASADWLRPEEVNLKATELELESPMPSGA